MNKLLIAAVVGVVISPLWAIQGTISAGGDTKSGEIKWQARTKTYEVSYKKGSSNVSATYPIADVTSLDIDKPAGFDKAVEAVKGGNGASAIGVLTKIISDYKMLVWDKPAGRYLVEAYLAADNAQKAYEVAVGIISNDKSAGWKGELAPAYWQAMLRLGKTQQLESLLKKAASSGDRASSAAALVMRGDVILSEMGDGPDGCKKALVDAYLRVALMYNDPPCRDARVDATMKAASCFDKLGQAARAEFLRGEARKM